MMIAPRSSQYALKFLLAMLFFATVALTACGGKEAAQPSAGGANSGAEPPEIPMEQQTEQKLDPLTQDDVDLYLKVMRAAAERVKNPLPADTAALDAAKRILAGSASGRVPMHDDVMTLERANLVAMSMDQIVAEEMKLDGRAYRGIAEAVEAVVPNPNAAAASGDASAPVQESTPSPLEIRLNDVNATNKKFLAPYQEEIQKLIAVVRNPAKLPK
jgi:hypothetical protein